MGLTSFFAADHRGALAAYVLGSEARNEAQADSDVDVAVLFDRAPDQTLMGAAPTLETGLSGHVCPTAALRGNAIDQPTCIYAGRCVRQLGNRYGLASGGNGGAMAGDAFPTAGTAAESPR